MEKNRPPKIVSIPITHEIVIQAREDAQAILRQKGSNNPTTNDLRANTHVVGSIGEQAVDIYFQEQNIAHSLEKYFDKNRHSDECDFVFRGKCDVKTSAPKEYREDMSFLIKKDSRNKIVDWYIFVRLQRTPMMAHIFGAIPYSDFWNKCYQPSYAKYPCGAIPVSQLKSMSEFVYGL